MPEVDPLYNEPIATPSNFDGVSVRNALTDTEAPQFKKAPTVQVLAQIAQSMVEQDLREPHSPIGVFQLPCGVMSEDNRLHTEIEVHEIGGVQEDMLSNPKISDDTKFDRLLAECIIRVGPFTGKNMMSQLPDEMTVGDKIFSIYAIRRASVGDIFPVIAICPNKEDPRTGLPCAKPDLHRYDLSTLEIRPMPDPMTREFEEKVRGVIIAWHVMCGRDQKRLADPVFIQQLRALKLTNDEVLATKNLYSRVSTIDGKPATLEGLRALGMYTRNHLRDRFEDVEGGVDTAYTMDCQYCGHSWKTEVDIGSQGFFSPSRVLRDWKKRSST